MVLIGLAWGALLASCAKIQTAEDDTDDGPSTDVDDTDSDSDPGTTDDDTGQTDGPTDGTEFPTATEDTDGTDGTEGTDDSGTTDDGTDATETGSETASATETTPCTDTDPDACGAGCAVCSGATPFCDGGQCVACRETYDCDTDQRCTADHTCGPCDVSAACGPTCENCLADGLTCATDASGCVACSGAGSCGEGAQCVLGACEPCDTATICGPTCVACAGSTPDCGGTTVGCVCNAGSCDAGSFCDAGSCAVCNIDAHCGASCAACVDPTAHCFDDGGSSSCVECTESGHCGVDEVCNASHACEYDPPCGIVVDEAFTTSALPAGWSIVDADGDAYAYTGDGWTWHWSDVTPVASGGYWTANSDEAGSGVWMYEWLYTAWYDGANCDTVVLEFDHSFVAYTDGTDVGQVQASNDGTNWSTLASYTSNTSGHVTFDLQRSGWSGTLMQVRFYYQGNYDFYWSIDNVRLHGTPE